MYKTKPFVIFIIGVSGVGKSTIGNLLSKKYSISYFDGDDYHSEENIKKMSKGQSLNDDDRYGWLLTLNQLAKKQLKVQNCIIACSALKEKYRDLLSKDIETNVKWVLLDGSFDQVLNRLKNREDHYMPISLLKSQFKTLEKPINALKIDIGLTTEEIVETIKKQIFNKSEFGLIGLGVMGKSLSINITSKGIALSVYNRYVEGLEEDVAVNFKNEFSELSNVLPFDKIESFVTSLQTPRKIMLMVNAGKTVDIVIDNLIPYLSKNDIIIDGGNSHYKDTRRRIAYLKNKNINFIGAGISGGEEGALKGPSIMPSGNKEAYKVVKPFLESIAASDKNNLPCCTYIGNEGSGHFVKMIHNGIEYVEMQLLAEVYFVFKTLGKNPDEIANIFEGWKTKTNSYLLEITVDILRKKNEKGWILDLILDKAGNKGTGNWATVATAELGVPSTMIASALFARYLSSFKEERVQLNEKYTSFKRLLNIDVDSMLTAYQLARLVNHHQGFKILIEASESYGWELNLSEIARIWTNGCIIRSSLMEELVNIFKLTDNMMLNKNIIDQIKELKPSLNEMVSQCVLEEIPIPCFSEAVNFLNAYTKADSSANIIQAQRDYFGAHTYQHINDSSEKYYHTNWKKNNS